MDTTYWIVKPIAVLVIFSLVHFREVHGVTCYQCDNNEDTECGIYFKSHAFIMAECGNDSKCGLQRQPSDRAGWIGIIRNCYNAGDLPGVNESDGCHDWHHPYENFALTMCICSTDGCNGSRTLIQSHTYLASVIGLLCSIVLLINHLQFPCTS